MSAPYTGAVVSKPDSANAGHNEIAALLACEIISGERQAGSRMPSVDEMFERFGTSRVLLREVAKTLTAKGLIVARSKVGTLVLPPERWHWFDPDFLSWRVRVGVDRSFFEQLTEMRRAVEPAAAALAASQPSREALAEIWAALEAMRTAGLNQWAFGQADLRFHVALGAASGNPLFRCFSSVVEAALAASFSFTAPLDQATIDVSVARHAAIAHAVEARDPAAAAAAMLVVIDEGAERIAALRP